MVNQMLAHQGPSNSRTGIESLVHIFNARDTSGDYLNGLPPQCCRQAVRNVPGRFLLEHNWNLAQTFEETFYVCNQLKICLTTWDQFNERNQVRRVKWMCNKTTIRSFGGSLNL